MSEVKLVDQPEYKALVAKVDALEKELYKLRDSYLRFLDTLAKMY